MNFPKVELVQESTELAKCLKKKKPKELFIEEHRARDT